MKHAGVPELVEPKAAGFTSLSPEETQTLVSALHHSMLHAVDLMGVGGNVPVLDSEDRSSTSGFASAQLPVPPAMSPPCAVWPWPPFAAVFRRLQRLNRGELVQSSTLLCSCSLWRV